MKAVDFFCLNSRLTRPLLFGFLICITFSAVAKPPAVETFSPPKELDLTLPEKYRESAITPDNLRRHKRTISNAETDAETTKEPNIGCGMDVTPLSSSDASFGNRVVGKCKLSYYY